MTTVQLIGIMLSVIVCAMIALSTTISHRISVYNQLRVFDKLWSSDCYTRYSVEGDVRFVTISVGRFQYIRAYRVGDSVRFYDDESNSLTPSQVDELIDAESN